jgi:hypothetical protein
VSSATIDVPGYRHQPGNHCGSTALRNLLGFHGLALSEEMVFGLGAGANFYYVTVEGESPSRFFNGRAARLEEQFLELTGTPLEMPSFGDDSEASWQAARETVDAGRPAILLTYLFYLDHYGNSAHFPGHAVVLAGYDDERVWLSDTGFPDLQETRIENLKKARHGKHPIFRLEGQMVRLPEGAELADVRGVAPAAIALAARQAIEPALGEFEGLPALRRFAEEIGSWPELAEDWQWCARFGYQVIEKRGTGGGNFRAMFARFLGEVADQGLADVTAEAELAAQASEAWSALAGELREASESEVPDTGQWQRISVRAAAILALEERLWPALAEQAGAV